MTLSGLDNSNDWYRTPMRSSVTSLRWGRFAPWWRKSTRNPGTCAYITADCAAQVSEADYGQDYQKHPSILAIHERNTKGYFKFQHTNQALVEKLLRDINVRKSCGHDMISPRLLKELAAVIAEPIANIINSSVDLCKYPASWKMGQVTPLFKQEV